MLKNIHSWRSSSSSLLRTFHSLATSSIAPSTSTATTTTTTSSLLSLKTCAASSSSSSSAVFPTVLFSSLVGTTLAAATMSSSTHSTTTASTQSKASTLDRVDEHNVLFFLCDIQETFRDKIALYESLVHKSKFLLQCAHTLHIPVIITEQKPFKPTAPELDISTSNCSLFYKTKFSMLTDEVVAKLKEFPQRRHVYVFGIESHVCVLQTCLDLLRQGYIVHLVQDANASQRLSDHLTAQKRLEHEGAIVTTTESAIFEILQDAKHPKFKALVPFIKELAANTQKDDSHRSKL